MRSFSVLNVTSFVIPPPLVKLPLAGERKSASGLAVPQRCLKLRQESFSAGTQWSLGRSPWYLGESNFLCSKVQFSPLNLANPESLFKLPYARTRGLEFLREGLGIYF